MGTTDEGRDKVTLEHIHVAGLPVAKADIVRALDELWNDARTSRPRVYVLVNAFSATLRRQPAYGALLLSRAETVPLADGTPLLLGAILTGQGRIGRCPGPDLMEAAAARAGADGTSFYLLGGGDGVVRELAAALSERYPGLRVAGVATPPFGDWSDEQSALMVDTATASGADVVWLGVSAPKQEIWASQWASRIGRPVVCVGAAFDFLSRRKARAPRWMRAIGLEWLFRLVSEPRRLWKRYIVGNAMFLWDLVRWGRNPAH
jgi:N-acetylglucosaminyldiphosphoundecaprenol N-acetyl-beta-D-mannosaminyltransferase